MANRLKIEYKGSKIGKIYLSDVGKRYGLGGGNEGDYRSTSGQDTYIVWGETVVLDLTGEVLRSMTSGVLKFFSTAASSTAFTTGAPLTLAEGAFSSANEYPRRDLGATGGTKFSDAYLAILRNDKYAPTGAAGATGAYVGGNF